MARRFEERFGRPPGPEDPVFFDPEVTQEELDEFYAAMHEFEEGIQQFDLIYRISLM